MCHCVRLKMMLHKKAINNQNFKNAVHNIVTVHTRHSQNRAFSAFRCFAALFAHEMALPSHIHAGRFSCEHEICPQEYASEL